MIDCHSVCVAIADAYIRAGRYTGDGERPLLWYATASLHVNYLKPTPLSFPFTVKARVTNVERRRTSLLSELGSDDGTLTCTGEVVAVQVPDRRAREEGYYSNRPN